MCAIIDANVVGEAFGRQTEAGHRFYDWLMNHGRLIIGGTKLKAELGRNEAFKAAFAQLQQAGRTSIEEDAKVDTQAQNKKAASHWKSDDWHILALATLRENEVRILYSNDKPLHQDFKRIRRHKTPKALIYSTLVGNGAYLPRHKNMLKRNLCSKP